MLSISFSFLYFSSIGVRVNALGKKVFCFLGGKGVIYDILSDIETSDDFLGKIACFSLDVEISFKARGAIL